MSATPTTSLAGKTWELRVPGDAAGELEDALGVLPATARVLSARGFADADSAEQFLYPSLDGLHSPFAFREMDAAVDRLLAALRDGHRIAVHGDYDVDGISGGVLLTTTLRHLGAEVDLLLPHRVADGYGFSRRGVDRALQAGARLMVTVDCGITAFDACAYARERDLDVIIADHHVPRAERPEAVAILNPRDPLSGYPEPGLAAVGVAFKLAQALLQKHESPASGLTMLRLVALGTVADLVPLTGENRIMTYTGLRSLAETSNPGLLALMQVAGVDPSRVTAGDVGYRLAPRINAAGRIGHPDEAASLFLTRDASEARRLAGRLHDLNATRQEMERGVVEQALLTEVDGAHGFVVAAGEGWHRGVIGIVASRLVERFGRPALVICLDGDEAYGSARSIAGVDLVAALDAASSVLVEYGGHHQAAGFQLRTADVGSLREALAAHAATLDPADFRQRLVSDAELTVGEVGVELALELDRLAPFGIGNPRPRFVCRDVPVVTPVRLLKGEHIKLEVGSREAPVEALGWRKADWAEALAGRESLSLVGRLSARRWGGRVRVQIEIDDIEL